MPTYTTVTRFVSAAAVVLATTVAMRAQSAQSPAQRERPEPIAVDFTAIGANGLPVMDLKAADVIVRIDGRTRVIRSLRPISVAPPPAAGSGPVTALAPPFASNTVGNSGRALILIIEEDSFLPGREQPIRNAVNGLMQSLIPEDQVMLVAMPYGAIKVPFTTQHTRVQTALATIAGQRPQNETGQLMACRTRRVLESLGDLLSSRAGSLVPTTMVFFTAGVAPPRRDAPTSMAPGMCELQIADFERISTVAGASRSNFYIVHPDDLALNGGGRNESLGGFGFTGSDNPLEGIEHLAGATGGRRVPLTALGTTALARVARETSSYYVAEIEPDRTDSNGRTKKMSVRVSRPGVDVRARPEITFAVAGAPRPATRATAAEMLLVTGVFTELPLRATAFTLAGVDGKVKVVAVAEAADRSRILASAAAVLVDANNGVVARWTAADAGELPLIGAMLVAPGTYRLRVAATDTNGSGGTVDYEVAARLTPAGSLSLGSLVLGLSRDDGLTPRLEFGNEPSALGSFEIYGGAPGMPVTATLEIARSLDGPPIVAVPLALEGLKGGRFAAMGTLPIGALPPGDYVVRATVTVEGGASGRVVRTLRKVIR